VDVISELQPDAGHVLIGATESILEFLLEG
jgi:hypothetical protein